MKGSVQTSGHAPGGNAFNESQSTSNSKSQANKARKQARTDIQEGGSGSESQSGS